VLAVEVRRAPCPLVVEDRRVELAIGTPCWLMPAKIVHAADGADRGRDPSPRSGCRNIIFDRADRVALIVMELSVGLLLMAASGAALTACLGTDPVERRQRPVGTGRSWNG